MVVTKPMCAWHINVLWVLICCMLELWVCLVLTCFFVLKLNTKEKEKHTRFKKFVRNFLGKQFETAWKKKIDFHIKRIIKMRITIRSRQFLRMKNWFYNQLIEVNNGRVTFLSQQFILHNLLMTINSIVLCSLSACIRFVHMLLNICIYIHTHKSANITTKKTNTHTQFAIQWIA